jgi:hypothetical protein
MFRLALLQPRSHVDGSSHLGKVLLLFFQNLINLQLIPKCKIFISTSESQDNLPRIGPRFADIGSLSQKAPRSGEIQVREKLDLMYTLT